MKSKKTIVSLALIIAVLVLGIGYAALSQQLKVTGTATIAPDEFKVHFISDPAPTAGTNVTDVKIEDGEVTATVAVELDRSQSKLSATQVLGIINESPELYANFASTDTFTITYNSDGTDADGNTNLKADDYITVTPSLSSNKLDPDGGTANLTLLVELNDDAAVVATTTVTFTVTFTADASVN